MVTADSFGPERGGLPCRGASTHCRRVSRPRSHRQGASRLAGTVARSVGRLAYAARAGKAIGLSRNIEGVERTLERVAEWRDRRRPSWRYEVTEECERRVHELLGAQWPCEERQRFDKVWSATLDDLAARGLEVGRSLFGGWSDGDARLAAVAWCLARHLRPDRVVETGVARGLTTRVLLEALERNGRGRLESIDLPPLLEHALAEETAAAVPERLYERWDRCSAARAGGPARARRRSRADTTSSCTTAYDHGPEPRFEFKHVWPALAPGGAALIDDVEKNVATGRFLEAHRTTPAVFSWGRQQQGPDRLFDQAESRAATRAVTVVLGRAIRGQRLGQRARLLA